MAVAGCGHHHEYHGQNPEHECLDDTYEQLEHEDHGRDNADHAQQRGHHSHEHNPGEHVAKKTEGKRQDLRELGDELEQAHEHVDHAEHRYLEHGAEIEELGQVAGSQGPEADRLNCHDGDQCQRHGEVQIDRHAA